MSSSEWGSNIFTMDTENTYEMYGEQLRAKCFEEEIYRYAFSELGYYTKPIAILICIFGLLGNGYVLWLLDSHIKRNPFTTYILNLTAADFGLLMFLSLSLIFLFADDLCGLPLPVRISAIPLLHLCQFCYTASLCFHTIISIERCLSVSFLSCYQHRRPQSLSSGLSVLVWILCVMFCGMEISFYLVYNMVLYPVVKNMFIVVIWVLPPILAVFTLLLLAKMCCNSQHRLPGSLTTAILLSLLFFLLCHGPWSIAFLLSSPKHSQTLIALSQLLYSVNGSIKPVLYYLVGKRGKCSSTEPLKVIFRRVFQDEYYPLQENVLTDAEKLSAVTCSTQAIN
ncbi:mas-related G-protein coupled receptor member H-like [Podarcis lilfordi]|uniref:Mas-related G-protein coupled receptor member H-like n=1 Tax=Podarcis lilfordi TaxID=74358 RepID=A0AA35PAN5_9SAUR|nr:mas-related G-protein coupled receptor member H-like [Podarcis lilfordi]